MRLGLVRLGAAAGRRVGAAEVVAWDSSQPLHLGQLISGSMALPWVDAAGVSPASSVRASTTPLLDDAAAVALSLEALQSSSAELDGFGPAHHPVEVHAVPGYWPAGYRPCSQPSSAPVANAAAADCHSQRAADEAAVVD